MNEFRKRIGHFFSFHRRFHESPLHMTVGIGLSGLMTAKGILHGLDEAHSQTHGQIWRPALYGTTGAVVGLVAGLYFIECGCLMVVMDGYQSFLRTRTKNYKS